MKIEPPLIDGRGYEDIMARIKTLARTYTPGWRLDESRPDFGVALARLFAELTAGSIERLNKTPQNHKTAFYNILGACANPALPAFGAVCFALSSPDADGSVIPRDFKLHSPVMDEQGTRFSYETQNEIFVTPAILKTVLYADAGSDTIISGMPPFISEDIGNGQKHALTIFHPLLERAHKGSRLYLTAQGAMSHNWCELMSNPTASFWDSPNGEIACAETPEGLCLIGANGAPSVTMRAQSQAFAGLPSPESLSVALTAEDMSPDAVYAAGERYDGQEQFAAFGETFTKNDALYFLSGNVLRQSGAHISLTFTLEFSEKLLGDMPTVMLPKKMLVPKTRYPQEKREDIVIEETAWEYWNGSGFMPLTMSADAGGIFRGLDQFEDIQGRREHTVTFVCPEIVPLLTGAEEGLYIRARISYISHEFERPARILIPHISGVRFSYHYRKPSAVTHFLIENNLAADKTEWLPPVLFTPLPEDAPSLFIVFDRPPDGGSVGFLFIMDEDGASKGRHDCLWQFWYEDGWKNLNAQDGTDGLCRTGIVSFTLPGAPAKLSRFGTEGYWLRAAFAVPRSIRIREIHLNAAPVLQCDSTQCSVSESELKYIQLPNRNIIDQSVFINTAPAGAADEIWEECLEGGASRYSYSVDRAAGKIEFSKRLRLTPAGRTVLVKYRYGGGAEANLPAGADLTLSLASGYVWKAVNPLPLSGGTPPESQEEAARRMAREIRHGMRPVTVRDYEDLAWEEDMAYIKCVSGRGGVTLVILTKEHSAPFKQVRERVLEKLEPVLPVGSGELVVRTPDFISVCVAADLYIAAGENDSGETEKALSELCDPYKAAEKYGIGRLPGLEEIRDRLLLLPRVLECRRVFVRYFAAGVEIFQAPPFALPVSGTHAITFL